MLRTSRGDWQRTKMITMEKRRAAMVLSRLWLVHRVLWRVVWLEYNVIPVSGMWKIFNNIIVILVLIQINTLDHEKMLRSILYLSLYVYQNIFILHCERFPSLRKVQKIFLVCPCQTFSTTHKSTIHSKQSLWSYNCVLSMRAIL